MSYAGDVSCTDCWETLGQDKTAQLVDVRTIPEFNFVGVPELGSVGKKPLLVEWQIYPSMEVNPKFVEAVVAGVEACGTGKDSKIFMLCRSGGRSMAAAKALTSAGFKTAYNVAGGFEGDTDEEGHRGNRAGWKFDKLPWVQR